ncbi:extracellular solute-binding protein [Paraburkholderia fungorum]|jgi:putative spermidine/putrescine transport system substrate-binding protein|uniref:extracellular solute-binding protein n=1 Tax=Paraburkholderia fungorum TaxID=134537 RepID=UPI000DB2610C|nr:extracellular solute-binding protein [Paraburkholderia fungorum]PZR48935.1 MAG: ABC transporter substrate-binding protein [Paraburkholderia fungorum]
MNSINRRNFLKFAAGAAMAPATGSLSSRLLAAENCPNIVVGTWGGDYQNLLDANIASPLMKPQGSSVVFSTADQTSRMTKMRAEKASRRGSLDVTCLSDVDMYEMNRSALLQPVQTALVPNLANTIEQFRKPYSIAQMFSAFVIVYTPGKGTPPKSFVDALDPRYKGKVGFSDILYGFVGAASALAAGDRTAGMMSGKDFLNKLKANAPKVYPSNETVAAALKSGEIEMTWMWKARAIQWKKAGVPIDFVVPTEGAIPALFEASVPKNAPDGACGYTFMNAMLDPKAQLAFAEKMGYAPTVKNAALPDALARQVGFTDAELSRFVMLNYESMLTQRSAFLDYWSKDFKVGL